MRKPTADNALFVDIGRFIVESKQEVAVAVNVTMSKLYWSIGKHIHRDFLQHSRADYGAAVIRSLAKQLALQYGK